MKRYLLLFSLLFSPLSFSDIDLSGLVINKTFSRVGHDFYRQYALVWAELPNTGQNNVVLTETLIPGSGTQLVVSINHEPVFSTFLGRKITPIKPQVEAALMMTMDHIAKAQFSSHSQDLKGDGF